MGAAALEMDASDGSGQTRWREIVAARLPSHDWPLQQVLITAVDAHTGEPVVFDSRSGIDLVDAFAASTSNGYGGGLGDRRKPIHQWRLSSRLECRPNGWIRTDAGADAGETSRLGQRETAPAAASAPWAGAARLPGAGGAGEAAGRGSGCPYQSGHEQRSRVVAGTGGGAGQSYEIVDQELEISCSPVPSQFSRLTRPWSPQ